MFPGADRIAFGLLILSMIITSCGTGTNINRMLYVSTQDKERIDHLISEGQIAYDSGEFDDAVSILESAKSISPDHAEVLYLLASAQMAAGGLDTIGLIKKIVDYTESSKAGSDTLNILSGLSGILDISSDDFNKLGLLNEQKNNAILKDIPIYLPITPGNHLDHENPRFLVKTLRQLNTAISTICPLMNRELLETNGSISMDRYKCQPVAGSTKYKTQAYVLFSMAHLIETLIFNSVLLYSSGDNSASGDPQTNSNIFKRIKKVEETGKSTLTLDSIGDYTEAITEVVSNVSAIFNTAPESMLSETMSNLRKTVSSFSYIDGIPDSVTSQIKKALDQIEQTAKQAGETVGDLSSETNVLAQKLGDNIVTRLNSEVDTFFSQVDNIKAEQGGNLTQCQEVQISTMCSTMGSLVSVAGVSLSAECATYSAATDPGNCDTSSTANIK